MAEIFNSLSNLEIRFLQEISPQSADRTPTALYQFVVHGTNKFLAQVNTNYDLKFEAFYQHQGKFYPHPYTLRPQINYPINSSLIVEQYSQLIYDISLYLELKRLQDFDREDLKRYYEAIDQSVDTNQDLQDFHDIYLVLQYTINGQSDRYQCHNGQPIHLPRFISHRWTHKNTLTRFRYDAEMRDGTFPCEMTLCRENVLQLQSYKIVLCFITNTIPPRMDYHAIRWSCKLKTKTEKERRSSVRNNGEEKLYYLHDPSGIVIAQVFGPDLKFSPQRFHSVRSYNEPSDFRNQLDKSDNKDNSSFAIAVIKGSDYPIYMKNRRRNPNILRYLPFNELDDDKKNLNMREEEIVKRPKTHKAKCNQQLDINNSNGTYSQAHVRLYVAAYTENDILLTECIHPPLRDSKKFEQIRIIRIVQPKCELYANESAYVYCEYNYMKPKSEHDQCPYEFQLVFINSINEPNQNRLLDLFNKPHICIPASFVPNCPCLLQFQIPDDPQYHEHRIFIRLRHKHSKDYNPSAIALADQERWIYYADPTSVTDRVIQAHLDQFHDATTANSTEPYSNIELQFQPVLLPNLPSDSEDSNHSNPRLNTPDLDLTTTKRFSFSTEDNDK